MSSRQVHVLTAWYIPQSDLNGNAAATGDKDSADSSEDDGDGDPGDE